jgi:hypothetical protein
MGPDGGVYTVPAGNGRSGFLGRGYQPKWSPDESRIVYVRQGNCPSMDAVWIMCRHSSNAHRIIVGASPPAWRP